MIGVACGPDFSPADNYALFEDRAGIPTAAYEFAYTPEGTGIGTHWGWSNEFHRDNLVEWGSWLGLDTADTVVLAGWDSIFYSGTEKQIDSLHRYAEGGGVLPVSWRNFTFLAKADRKRLSKAAEYLAFAIRLEPWSRLDTSEDSWFQCREQAETSPDPSDIDYCNDGQRHVRRGSVTGIPEELEQRAQKESDPFLRQRWFFQLAKFTFYQSRNPQGRKLLSRIAPELDSPAATLRWRSRMYRTGLIPDQAARNLALARIAWSWPRYAIMAANDFKAPAKDADWQRTLKAAQNRQDSLSLWFLMGLRTDPFAAMGKMLAIDSAAPYTGILASRELRRIEWACGQRDSMLNDTVLGFMGRKFIPAIAARSQKLRLFAVRMARSRRTSSPAYWNLLAGHLLGLTGRHDDAPAAERLLDSAAALGRGDSLLQLQVHRSRVLTRLFGTSVPTPALADFLTTELPHLDSCRRNPSEENGWSDDGSSFERVLRARMDQLWGNQPFLHSCLSGDLPTDPDQLLHFLDFWKQKQTPFIEVCKRRSAITDSAIFQSAGAALLLHQRYAEAVQVLSIRPDTSRLGTDPFFAGIRDNHDSDAACFSDSPWTRLSFARKLLHLNLLSREKSPAGAQAALELGIGLYNQTYFGNARSVYDGTAIFCYFYGYGTRDAIRFNVEPARRQFERAAREASDPETRALAGWLLVKCDRDQKIAVEMRLKEAREKAGGWEEFPSRGFRPDRSYAAFRARYGATFFWREAIRECGWLASWASGSR